METFHFLRPWWLLALPFWLLLSYRVWAGRRNQDGWASLCDPALLGYLTGETGKTFRSRPALAGLMIAGAAALTALAGPVWQQLPQPVFRAQSGLVVILDLSASMKAEDLQPDRLTRAKQKLQDILHARREGQTGLIVFAGSAFDVVPLSTDNHAILSLLESLEPSMMPVQGSNASIALEHALAMFKRGAIRRGDVVLLADGTDSEAPAVADRLAAAGHRLSVLGVGTPRGAPIPSRESGFLKDIDGNIVIPHLNEAGLAKLAARGNGVYQRIRVDDADVKALPGLTPAHGQATTKEKLQTDQWREEGPWLILALVLPLLALTFRRGVLVVLIGVSLSLLSANEARALEWKDLWQTPDQQGQSLMQKKESASAAQAFRDPQWKAAALYRAKKYRESAQALNGIESADGWYNKGNALAREGDLQAAVDAYDRALELNPSHQDAAFNRKLVEKLMKKQDNQQKKDKNQSKDGKKSDKKSDRGKQSKQDGQSQKGEQGERNNQSSAKKKNNRQDKQDGEGEASKSDKQHSEKEQNAQSMKEKRQQDQESGEKAAEASKGDKGGNEKNEKAAAQEKMMNKQEMEEMKAQQQWLRRIPDDPGGLLRRKFRYQYQQQEQRSGNQEAQSW
jgi:Ca-activated chloride channel family protein